MEKQNIARLFGNNPNISPEEKARVITELNKIGSLTFKIHKSEEGWMATCDEVSGIIAGNTNPNPTDSEIESQIRDAVYATFDIEMMEDEKEPFFSYKIIKEKALV